MLNTVETQNSAFPALTHPGKRAFLAAYAETANVVQAAKAAGIERRTHYNWMLDSDYAEAFERCRLMACDSLEAEAVRRATGYDEETTCKGEPTGNVVRRYSDILLIFLLKGWNPQKYHDRHEFRGQVDNTINVTIRSVLDPPASSATVKALIDVKPQP